MLPLDGSIGLRVIGTGAYPLDSKQVTQLLYHLAGKGQIIIHHKMQQSTKDVEVVVVQDTGHGMSSRIFCHDAMVCRVKWSVTTRTFTTSGFFFNSFLQSPLTSILVKSRWSRSIGPVASIGTSGALTLSLS